MAPTNTEKYLALCFHLAGVSSTGLILFIVPGIVLALRYALAMPIAIFEDVRGKDALKVSSEYMQGKACRLILCILGGLAIYLPGAMGLIFFMPEQETPLLNAVTTIPFNILGVLFLPKLSDCR